MFRKFRFVLNELFLRTYAVSVILVGQLCTCSNYFILLFGFRAYSLIEMKLFDGLVLEICILGLFRALWCPGAACNEFSL